MWTKARKSVMNVHFFVSDRLVTFGSTEIWSLLDRPQCFSLTDLAETPNGTLIPIGELREGMEVLAMDANERIIRTEILSILHYDTKSEGIVISSLCSSLSFNLLLLQRFSTRFSPIRMIASPLPLIICSTLEMERIFQRIRSILRIILSTSFHRRIDLFIEHRFVRSTWNFDRVIRLHWLMKEHYLSIGSAPPVIPRSMIINSETWRCFLSDGFSGWKNFFSLRKRSKESIGIRDCWTMLYNSFLLSPLVGPLFEIFFEKGE